MSMRESSNLPVVVSSDFESYSVRQAVAGYLAGFGESTRKSYGLDLRQWMYWCRDHDLRVFQVKRAHIELYARWLEERDGPVPRLHGGCRRSRAFIGIASRRS